MSRLNGKLYEQVEETFASDSRPISRPNLAKIWGEIVSRLNGKLYGQVEETFALDSDRICGPIRPRFRQKMCQDFIGNMRFHVKNTICSIFLVCFELDANSSSSISYRIIFRYLEIIIIYFCRMFWSKHGPKWFQSCIFYRRIQEKPYRTWCYCVGFRYICDKSKVW